VGGRTAHQVNTTVDRYNAQVPEALWSELAALGLIPALSIFEGA
jgi:hypothetical protein